MKTYSFVEQAWQDKNNKNPHFKIINLPCYIFTYFQRNPQLQCDETIAKIWENCLKNFTGTTKINTEFSVCEI